MTPESVGRLVEVNGARLFVDDRGAASAPPVVFVHGGPGQGAFDFMASQGDLLAARLRIIGVDRRGVLRSDPADVPITIGRIVDDLETLRRSLAIPRWTVLAHSAGGMLALEYALSHPRRVTGVVFDCPCWDADLTDRRRLPIAAARLEAAGLTAEADRCRAIAAKPGRLGVEDDARGAMRVHPSSSIELHFHTRAAQHAFQSLLETSGFTQDQWANGDSHRPLMAELYKSRLALLRLLEVPSLLLRGVDDLATTPEMVEAFERDVEDAQVVTFAGSGHFAYHEEPARYAQVVTEWVLAHT